MTDLPTPSCLTCGGTDGLRVVRPRAPMTASTFLYPEIRCIPCCKATKGMFRLCVQTPQKHMIGLMK